MLRAARTSRDMDWSREFCGQSRRHHRPARHRFADQNERFVCPRFRARLHSSSSRSVPLLVHHRRTKTAIFVAWGGLSSLATSKCHCRPVSSASVGGKGIPMDISSETRRSEEHTSELQSLAYLVCRLLLEK